MEKLQRFNRILFTIMSIAVILLVIIIFMALINTFFISNDPYTYKKKKEIISTEKAQELLKANKHAQIISFMEMHPIKNSNNLFIIPVSQVSLKEPKQRREMIRINQIDIPTYPKYESFSSYYGYYKRDELLNN
jgi:sortase (surface protein transpeptidase)